ncbi:M1 family metallopeptidase [Zunongwangia sp. SCSIO 43204]|uniref:M1 family metallopeptidase n=1 Tax=Zunongwangia sp. SCSIO 43204 TaxID=2779359 RepID=UPI001CA8B153|nr:M1 family metallopeptidase [Zunongwangia sp. SCSIO 43204]UAB84552.1 M1 family metallopeptidase [Zunongwangia sp. SCSIO 43204]
MKTIKFLCSAFLMFAITGVNAQDQQEPQKPQGHTNQNKFRQLYQEFRDPSMYRTASGAPGEAYYQNEADYEMDIVLDDENTKLSGKETITYHNNSKNKLEYLWMQLDQNIRKKDAPALEKGSSGMAPVSQPGRFADQFLKEPFDGGFNIEEVKTGGDKLSYTINNTMMRIDLPEPLEAGESFTFSVKWWYNVNNHVTNRARSGYEEFEDGHRAYEIAQFFPRMAVYNDVEGWQNMQFWGSGEFALPFGDYEVSITVPADHVMEATGMLQNRDDVYTKDMMKRYKKAQKSYDEPVIIRTQEEAVEASKGFEKKTKTWEYKAEMVRDFAFATSRRFILDMMAVKMNDDSDVMAVSIYPKEGNPLWEKWSTRVVASTLQSYSDHTFIYPYHKAVSVHAKNQGMEYPMICWNYGRPDENGEYSDRVKFGMMGVIIHEVGHNFFPMIVNSDERQWGWMDEGINTFVQYMAEQEFGERYPDAIEGYDTYPSRRGIPANIVPYMKGNQDFIAPIMANPEEVYQLGNNAYGKPATALNILRETVMGRELFDHAFHTYSKRWMFKHPTPEDFFRTMEDASAVDLDWFWRGWFYTTDYTDMGVEDVKKYYVTDKQTKQGRELLERYGANPDEIDAIYVVEEGSEEFEESMKGKTIFENSKKLNEYVMDNFSSEERSNLEVPKYFYQVTFNKPGGLVMPLIVEYTYADGSTEMKKYPVQVWMKNDSQVTKTIATDKEITKVVVDPDLETADIDLSNNSWPKEETPNEFEEFKNNTDG